MPSFDLSGFAAPVNRTVESLRSIPWAVAIVGALPLAVTVLARLLSSLASIDTNMAVSILGLLGMVGGAAQFLASEKFKRLNRQQMNAAEIVLPVAIIIGGSVGALWFMLPPSPFNDAIRETLDELRLRTGQAG